MMVDPLIIWVSAAVPATIFGATVWHKLIAPNRFRVIVEDYRVLPAAFAGPVAYTLPYIEIGVVFGLLIPLLRQTAAVASLALILIFTVALAINLRRGRLELECGCHFGSGPGSLSSKFLARNAVLAIWILPAAATTGVAPRPMGWLDGLTVVASSLVAVSAYAMVGTFPGVQRAGWARRFSGSG
jgi:Methylamine utilisation protein MauE